MRSVKQFVVVLGRGILRLVIRILGKALILNAAFLTNYHAVLETIFFTILLYMIVRDSLNSIERCKILQIDAF